jgi:hypothetical protein
MVGLLSVSVLWVLSLALLRFIPVEANFSFWQPEDIYRASLRLMLDHPGWIVHFSVATLLLTIVMTRDSGRHENRADPLVFSLVYSGFAGFCFMSGNLLTLMFFLALFDICGLVYLHSTHAGELSISKSVLRLGLDLTSILIILWTAVVLNDPHPRSDAIISILLLLAVLMRIGLFPYRLSGEANEPIQRWSGSVYRFLPAAVALMPVLRAPFDTLTTTSLSILLWPSLIIMLAGGMVWLLFGMEPVQRPLFVLSMGALAIAASALSTEGEIVLASAIASMILAGSVLSLARVIIGFHRLWILLAVMILVGLPVTTGGVYGTAIGESIFGGGRWAAGVIALLGLALIGGGGISALLQEKSTWTVSDRMAKGVYTAGIALPVVASIGIAGLTRRGLSGYGGLVFILEIVVLCVIYFFGRNISDEQIIKVQKSFRAISPRSMLSSLEAALGGFFGAARGLGGILEGEGAMLWLYVIVLLLLIAIGS